MPSNRTRRSRKMIRPLSPAWRAFFETGANEKGNEDELDIFIVQCHEEEMRKVWKPYREEILAQWKREGKLGLHWIVEYLRGVSDADE